VDLRKVKRLVPWERKSKLIQSKKRTGRAEIGLRDLWRTTGKSSRKRGRTSSTYVNKVCKGGQKGLSENERTSDFTLAKKRTFRMEGKHGRLKGTLQ